MIEWVVAGLGNPGDRYVSTRHNVGFMVAETMTWDVGAIWTMNNRFQAALTDNANVCFVEPHTYMNLSGISVGEVARFYKVPPERVIVVHDDLDIEFGVVKAQFGKGPKMHNGLNSVTESLGTSAYWRIRVGVDDRTPEERSMWPGERYVLMPLSDSERNKLQGGLHAAAEAAWDIIRGERVRE
jgi:PTH1 family peptidyl-tRNA hydrolase